jgi:hypothetical protein
MKSGAATAGKPSRRLGLRLVVGALLLAILTLAVVLVPSIWQAWQEGRHRPGVPPRVDGLVLDESPAAQDTVEQLHDALKTGVPLRSSIGAAYTDTAARPGLVIFIWGTGAFAAPEASLDAAFASRCRMRLAASRNAVSPRLKAPPPACAAGPSAPGSASGCFPAGIWRSPPNSSTTCDGRFTTTVDASASQLAWARMH